MIEGAMGERVVVLEEDDFIQNDGFEATDMNGLRPQSEHACYSSASHL